MPSSTAAKVNSAPTMDVNSAPAMDVNGTGQLTFSADGDQLVIEGLRPTVLVGEDGTDVLAMDSENDTDFLEQSTPLPSMVFKGKAQTVVSGADICVQLPGIPEHSPSSKTMEVPLEKHPVEDCAEVEIEQDVSEEGQGEPPVDLANVDIASVSSKGYASDMSEEDEDDEDKEFELNLGQLLDENEQTGGPSSVSTEKAPQLSFYTKASLLAVQGLGMNVTICRQQNRKQTFQRLCPSLASPRGRGFCTPNMTFVSKDTAMVVRGAQGVVHVTPQGQRQNEEVPSSSSSMPVQESTSAVVDRNRGLKALQDRKISDYHSLREIPVRLLSYDIRLKLAILLEPVSLGRDWRSLADKMGISYQEIRYMESEKSPLFTVLNRWETAGEFGATVGQLLNMLAELDRKDAITTLTEHLLDMR